MRFLVTIPPFDLFKEGYGSKRSIRRGQLPPLGMGAIAGVALKAGIDTTILDPSASGWGFERTLDEIRKFSPDVVGISSLTSYRNQAFKLADMVKSALGVPVIIGGPQATCFPEETITATKSVDYIVLGEGDTTIVPLLKCIARKERPRGLKGVAFADGETIINNGNSDIEQDLDALPSIPRSLYNNLLYSPLPYAYRRLPATVIITSRGCSYSKCAFCFSAGRMKARYRRHSPERVIDEIGRLVKDFKVKEILFFDDNFLVNKRWVMAFCGLLERSGIDITWSALGRVDTVDQEMLKRVASVGCWSIYYGLESGVQRLLDIIEKGITVEGIRRAVKWTHEAGMETRGSFMLAIPGETPADAMATIDFAVSLDLDYAQFNATFPDPGTKIYDLALSQGKIKTYRGISRATFVPDGYKDDTEVERMVSLGYKKFYFRPYYIWKRVKSIRSFSDIVRYAEGLQFIRGLRENLNA